MGRQSIVDQEIKAFEKKFETSFEQIRRQKGNCPDVQFLIEFQSHELSQEESVNIKGHVQDCAMCETILEAIARFDEAVENFSPGEGDMESEKLADDEITLGVDHPIMLEAPPSKVTRLSGKLKSVRAGRCDLALSDTELSDLLLEEDNE